MMKNLSGFILICFTSFQFTFAQVAPEFNFSFDSISGTHKLILSGLEKEDLQKLKMTDPEFSRFQEFFPVYFGKNAPEKTENLPPVAGKYVLENDAICFTPRYPYLLRKSYYACFYAGKFKNIINSPVNDFNENLISFVFMVENTLDNQPPEVTQVYPSLDVIPQNQLRIYIHFSKKMLTGHSLEHIKLYNQKGEPEENAFLHLDPELWDPSGKRLTIWFDPGRIKRDLSPNLQYGVPLRVGEKYTLQISTAFKDIQGNRLHQSFEKTFVVGKADRSSPKPENWEITYPEPNSTQPLSIFFNEAMDQALTSRMIEVFDENNMVKQGSVTIGKEEKSWTFTPSENWISGKYQISINTKLEDLAGNSLQRLFDAETTQFSTTPSFKTKDFLTLEFEIPAF
ncbi:Ig-like domain-containing protein [Flexithrix dorotheae]|uniref:Ig-like domain-containing protein n=1 Tax=Flexithrix dorotheae TaxID=70993 RepID=UPI0003716E21|nr:Ig-like domain-containing protein [Flexithrix dorotheae]